MYRDGGKIIEKMQLTYDGSFKGKAPDIFALYDEIYEDAENIITSSTMNLADISNFTLESGDFDRRDVHLVFTFIAHVLVDDESYERTVSDLKNARKWFGKAYTSIKILRL